MLEHHVEPRSAYLCAVLRGRIDLESAYQTFLDVLRAARMHRQPRILLDLSAVTGVWMTRDRFAFGEFAARQQQREAKNFAALPRVAIYAVAPLMDPDHFTQTVANNRGARIRTSDNFEELVAWLETEPRRLIAA